MNLLLVVQGRILLTVLGGRGFKPGGKKLRLPCLVLGSGGGLHMATKSTVCHLFPNNFWLFHSAQPNNSQYVWIATIVSMQLK